MTLEEKIKKFLIENRAILNIHAIERLYLKDNKEANGTLKNYLNHPEKYKLKYNQLLKLSKILNDLGVC